MEQILKLLKLDLGISHDKRDAFLNALIANGVKDLASRGIILNENDVEDQILVSDYAAWHYRKRLEDAPLSNNLQWRIRNRIVKERAKNV